jgi:fused signal recognition particle receptor
MNLFENIDFSKLREGLSKTRTKIVNTINETITRKAVLDDKTLDEIEEILITSDIGSETSEKIIESVRERMHKEKDRSKINILESVKKELVEVLKSENNPDGNEIEKYKPYVILIVGVNGAGKTTTIGKLAHNFRNAAADTFRAAANEQLVIWAERAGVDIVQKNKGTDPSSVAFDTIHRAIKEKYDVVLIDTAGRLHTKANLMDELSKIKRVSGKVVDYAPNETLLVLDGTTGQNALRQTEEFSKVTHITGLVITKLDGTAKGGVVFQICSGQKIPVKYIGVGEKIGDLQTFNPDLFVSAIFDG